MKDLLKQDLENYKKLKAQYEKEVIDAERGAGMCSGMPSSMRRGIISELHTSIRNLEISIKKASKELEILERSDNQLMHWYMTYENTDVDFYPEAYVRELTDMASFVLEEMKTRKLDGEPFIRYKSYVMAL